MTENLIRKYFVEDAVKKCKYYVKTNTKPFSEMTEKEQIERINSVALDAAFKVLLSEEDYNKLYDDVPEYCPIIYEYVGGYYSLILGDHITIESDNENEY